MGRLRVFVYIVLFSQLTGCRHTGATKPDPHSESSQEIISAIGEVSGAMGGRKINQDDLKKLHTQMQKDPETQEAVGMISDSLSRQNSAHKYCPVDGERYSAKLEECPVHKVKLLPLP